jgi:Rnl2 family RNA ligase
MEFKKYTSLENAKQRLVNVIEDHGFANKKYVVTEKIHGANFGIHLDVEAKDLKFSRRKAFLREDESFNGYTGMITKFREGMDRVSLMYPEVKVIRVFGEIHGGSLMGKQGDNSVRVQSQVQYSPNNEFSAFELYLDWEPQPFDVMSLALQEAGFNVVPLLGVVDNIYDALAYANDGNSVVPALLGYESPEVNTKEGNVIVPATEVLHFNNGSRVAVKDKNNSFKERDNDKPVATFVPLSEKATKVLTLINANLTENRLSNVLSKESVETLTHKDFGRIVGLLVQDALADFSDYSDEVSASPKEVVGGEWPKVSRVIIKEAQDITRAYFIENIF